MITRVLLLPGTDIVRHGTSSESKATLPLPGVSIRSWAHVSTRPYLAGQSLAVKQQIIDMAMNANGIRDTARVLYQSHR